MGDVSDTRIDAHLRMALNHAYHDRAGAWNTTAVRLWIKYHVARGEEPFELAGPNAPHAEHLQDELRLMRFETWLVYEKRPTVSVGTAEGYGSTVQGLLAREFGSKIGAGRDLYRRTQMHRGMHRLAGGRRSAKKKRRAISPAKLQQAMDKELNPDNPLHANVRAALSTMLQGLLRGGEAGISDKRAKAWTSDGNVNRADVHFTKEAMHMNFAPLKKASLGAKDCPAIIGRAERAGQLVDAPAEVMNMFRVDRVSPELWKATPMFRDPRTNRALKVSELNNWVKHLMRSIGEDPTDYGSHSCRIGGATAMFAAGFTPLDIRMMGRWDSEIYRVYVRADRGRAAMCSRAIGRAQLAETALEYEDEALFFSDTEL